MTVTIQINKKQADNIEFIVSTKHLKIKFISMQPLPGRFPIDDPDTEVTLQILNENMTELYFLGYHLGKEKLPFRLST